MFSVYKATCVNNGKSYVGFTGRSIAARWKAHLSSARNGSKFRFHSAIRKHGENSWTVVSLGEFEHESDARKFEERMIGELGLVQCGYNAKPGGCGGWIVPAEKLSGWRDKLSLRNVGTGNGNYSGLSDEEILKKFELGSSAGVYQIEAGLTSAVKACAGVYGTPKSYRKFRFPEYGGGIYGLRGALRDVCGIIFPEHPVSADRRAKISKSMIGRNWYTELATGKQIQSRNNPGDGWIKGRKYVKN